MTGKYFADIKISKSFIIAIVLLCASELSFSGRFDSFPEESIWLMREIELILIKNGVSSSRVDCRNKKIDYYSRSIETGVHVNIYSVTDSRSIKDICLKTVELYTSRNDISIIVEFYDVSHEKAIGFFGFRASPFSVIKLTRKK